MTRALAAALFLAAPASAGPADCSAAYKPEYEEQWEVTKPAWDSYCAKGYAASDALRQGQRDSMARCTARFAPYEKAQKIPTGEAAALCAQGADGRERLAARTGERPKPPPPPVRAEPRRKPGASNMGPFGRALDVARSSWRPDACFAGLYYASIESTYISVEEWTRARAAGRPPEKDKVELEEYAYYFHSGSDAVNSYRVSFGDKIESAFCYKVDRMDGPDHTDTLLVTGLGACLGDVDVDLPTAIDIATKNGWALDTPLKAYLVNLPSGHFQRACRSAASKNAPVDCGLLAAWDSAKLRRTTGKPVWVLTAAGRTAFLDARGGRFRYLAPGPVDLRAAKSFKYAEACMEDKKGGGAFSQESQ